MLIERQRAFFLFFSFLVFLGAERYVAFASVGYKGFSKYWLISWTRSPRHVLPSFGLVKKKKTQQYFVISLF